MTVRVTTAHGTIGDVIVARILPATDLISGILETCRITGIETGVITSCVGSLKRAQFHWSIPSTKTKRGSKRTEPIILEGPIELLNGQGLIGKAQGEEYLVHFHATLCDKEGKVYGGHLFEGGNLVHSTMDVVIVELQGIHLEPFYDQEIDLTVVTAKEG
jgi:predicted DNA-binding protein with PD1-like motif